VLPDEVEGEFFRSRKAQESEYLEEIGRRFGRTPRVNIRQLPRDVHGLAALQAISDQLLG
jgi:arsenite-transporting ATPase